MPIKEFAVFDQFLQYSGPFELKEFYLLIDNFVKNHHYDKWEKRHIEHKTEEGRYIELELEPQKQVSESMKLYMNMEIFIRNIQDLEVEVKGKKRIIQQADISIRWRSYVNKIYGELWEKRPVFFFIRALVDKFFYRLHIERFTDELKGDTQLLREQLKAFLNLYQRR